MLRSFSVENFHSIKEKITISFEMDKDMLPEGGWSKAPSGNHYALTLGFLGANGSGKTNILRSMSFVLWFMQNSFSQIEGDEAIPIMSWFSSKKDTIFIIHTEDENGDILKYTLKLNDKHVTFEELMKDDIIVFRRKIWKKNEKKLGYNIQLSDPLQGIPKDRIRPNISLISIAKQYGISFPFLDVRHFSNVIGMQTPTTEDYMKYAVSIYYDGSDNMKNKIDGFVKSIDSGINSLKIDKQEITDPKTGATQPVLIPRAIHDINKQKEYLPLALESEGTRAFFGFIGRFLKIMNEARQGGCVIIDEIETHLHPKIVEIILDLFNNKDINKKGIQLIFSTHTPMVIDILGLSHIYIAEKENGASHFYRLSDFDQEEVERLREKTTFSQIYLNGLFGGTPNINNPQ